MGQIETMLGQETEKMSLKALAKKVLDRDSLGTKNETEKQETEKTDLFWRTQAIVDEYQERAAIRQYEGNMSKLDAEASTYEELREKMKQEISKEISS